MKHTNRGLSIRRGRHGGGNDHGQVERHSCTPLPVNNGGRFMKISARNTLKGKIVKVEKGTTTAHVTIDIGGGAIVTASITNAAVDDLKLAAGKEAYAVIKASDVMVAVD
jgi:molybdopterin-binding protein